MANKAVWGGYRNTVSEWSDDDSDADDERPAERAAKRQRTSPSQQLPQAQQQQARQQHGQQHGQGQQQKQALLKPPAQPGQSGRQTLQQKQAPQRQQLQKPAPPPPQQQSNVTQEQQVPKRAKLSPQGSAQHMVLPSPATKSGGHKTPGSAGGVGGGARPTPHLQPSPMELDTAPRSLSGVRPQPATIPRQRGGRPPLPPKQQQIPAADGRCPYQPPNQPAPKSPPAPSLLSGPSRKQQGAGGAAAAAAAGGKAADLAAGSGSAGSWRTAGAALLASKETQGELARMHRRSNDAWMSADSLSEDTQRLSLGPSGNAISAAEDLQKRSHVGLTANESACKHARHVANACFKAVHPHDAPINLVSGGGSQQPQLSAQEQLQQAADELDAAYERLQTGEPFDAQLQQQLQLLRDGVQALRQPVPTYDALTEPKGRFVRTPRHYCLNLGGSGESYGTHSLPEMAGVLFSKQPDDCARGREPDEAPHEGRIITGEERAIEEYQSTYSFNGKPCVYTPDYVLVPKDPSGTAKVVESLSRQREEEAIGGFRKSRCKLAAGFGQHPGFEVWVMGQPPYMRDMMQPSCIVERKHRFTTFEALDKFLTGQWAGWVAEAVGAGGAMAPHAGAVREMMQAARG